MPSPRPTRRPTAERRHRPRLRLAVGLGALVLAALAGLSLLHAAKAARAAIDGKAALLQSERLVASQQLEPARTALQAAKAKFDITRREMDTATRFLPIVRYVPFVRSQVRAVETLADAGLRLSDAGISLSDAAAVIIDTPNDSPGLSDALEQMRTIRGLLASGLTSIDDAAAAMSPLRGRFLPGPVGDARSEFNRRLPEIRQRAADSEAALSALITFVGGNGPRSYLFLSQNPDEVRPLGGFIGTYGVITGIGGKLAVDHYDSIENWIGARPEADATPEERGGPFKYDDRFPERLANVNTVPDWPQAAELAARMWVRGGEEPVNGVISFTPAFLAGLLSVLGPVEVESYGEHVTAQNLVKRLDFYTHEQRNILGAERKEFVAVLAKAVMDRLIDARTSQLPALGRVMAKSFQAREAMIWSSDPDVASVLADRRWDAALPQVAGDFFTPAEFQYAAKNGRSLRRLYSHRVDLNQDGSGTVTTTVRITNPNPPDDYGNVPGQLAYVTLYGPEGATIGDGTDPLGLPEPAVAGHPARGWFRPISPQSETTITIVWDVPQLARPLGDGKWDYSLLWLRIPDHTGDILQLSFDLPEGWKWTKDVPPDQVSLDRDIRRSWSLSEG